MLKFQENYNIAAQSFEDFITPTVKIPINIGRVQSDMKFSKEIFGFIVVGVIFW